jgi:hypothetical protein
MNPSNEQGLMPTGARDEFVKGFDHRFGKRSRRVARSERLGNEQRVSDAGQHEQRGDQEHGMPRDMVGEHQRQRARDEARNAIRLNVDRCAKAKLGVRQQLAPVRVEHDVLARGKESHDRRQAGDRQEI